MAPGLKTSAATDQDAPDDTRAQAMTAPASGEAGLTGPAQGPDESWLGGRRASSVRHLLSISDLDRDGILEIMRLSDAFAEVAQRHPEGARAQGAHRGDCLYGAVDAHASVV